MLPMENCHVGVVVLAGALEVVGAMGRLGWSVVIVVPMLGPAVA